MKLRYGIEGAVVFIASLALPGATQAAETSHFRISNHVMEADFVAFDETGCSSATTSVIYAESVIQTSGKPTVQPPTVVVDLVYVNSCTGDAFELNGSLVNPSASIRGDLGTATLAASVPVSDGTVSATVDLDLTFTATADAQRVQFAFHSASACTIFNQHVRSTERAAQASGTMTTVVPLSTGSTPVDLAPSPSDSAFIGANSEGDITVITK
jgi:hypothetical protein